ncbi:ABC transporter substrate-binding protein [Pseudomonas fontis]|uniref:ABC transporter substrate-binding protein n=1 Tax=Pseudomonas fontis TaxID=2942633 RepID=A0ABT5NXF5_9PSED|nr:ABC transporter substrate binding protein [Pseudomonas fontis]MDD0974038.1 ABC transporter substrate-binding protein [Pseudomonas fontis]MDD0992877.1 ABC transporter substrate-binding protein [Pseudomonas fontis]
MRWLRCFLLLALFWPLAPLMAAEILLTGSADNAGVQHFVTALSAQRPNDQVRFVPLHQLARPGTLKPATRLILLDLEALDWRLTETAGPPALVLRISRVQAEQRLGSLRPPFLTLLWSDPPADRQLRLTHYLLPQARRIGVLYGENSRQLIDELRQAARPLGLEIVAQAWPDTRDNRALQTLLKDSDVLLGLDDPQLFNPKTAKNILLSSYARQMALIGPSAGFVRAGGLASTLSDQDDWLAMLGQLLDQPTGKWPRALYPTHFSVAANQQVARALGIEAIDLVAAAKAVAAGEANP